jgi:hypothetical protein
MSRALLLLRLGFNQTVISRLTLFGACFVCLQTQHIKSSAPIFTYDAEDVFKLLNPDGQERTVCHLVESRKQSARKGAEEREPYCKAKAMTV